MSIRSLVPNLMVEDVARSADFWCSLLGMRFAMGVDASRGFHQERTPGAEFIWAQFTQEGAQLMVQRRDSLSEELPVFADKACGGSFTIYLHVADVDVLHARLKEAVPTVKEPHVTFYGMREWHIQDPDGYVVCLGQQT